MCCLYLLISLRVTEINRLTWCFIAALGISVYTVEWEYELVQHCKYQSVHLNEFWNSTGRKDYLVMKHRIMIWKLEVHSLAL